MAAVTYDPPETNAAFVAKSEIGYPLLSDVDAATVKAYGVLNEDYEPGHRAYGIPHPGIVYIAAGTIIVKRAVPGYRQRPPFDELLEAVSAVR